MNPGLDQARELLELAHAHYLAAIEAGDPREGFRHASELSTWHREMRTPVSHVRARQVARVREEAKTSFADTGAALGVSTARIQQLYRRARELGATPDTHHRYRARKDS